MFELALPWVLVALPLPWLIWFFVPRASPQLPSALKVPFFNAMVGVVDGVKFGKPRSSNITGLFFVWFLVLVALAGPRYVGEPRPLVREGYNIMLALDISGSMEMSDMSLYGRPATRLAVVKHAAMQFVQHRAGDRIGLILFGSQAYLQTPLTYDRHNVLQRLEDASAGLAGKSTSIGDALGLAVKRLQSVPAKGRMIILLTDGVNNSGVLAPLKAAELAHAEGIKIYTIGLGASIDPRALSGMFLDMNVSADLDEDTLKEVSSMTRGRYFRATDIKSLQTIYQIINKMETTSQNVPTVRPQHDYYPWPLAMALFVFLLWLLDKAGFRLSTHASRHKEVSPL